MGAEIFVSVIPSVMNLCLWFLVLYEFGALQTSLLKHNRRMKQRHSLPLNAARGAVDRKSPSVVQPQSSGRVCGGHIQL